MQQLLANNTTADAAASNSTKHTVPAHINSVSSYSKRASKAEKAT